MSTPSRNACDIAVVGGGAAGLSAALAVARAGFRTVVFAPPVEVPRARTAALLGGSVAFLEALGVWPELEAAAAPLRAIRIVDGSRRLVRSPEVVFHAAEVGLPAFGYNVGNADLVEALRRACEVTEGVRVVPRAARRVELREDGAGVGCAGADYDVSLVIAADGARSVARGAAGIAVREWRYPQAALVATFATARPHDGVSTEFHTETGPFTLVPLPGQRVSLVWLDRPEQAEANAGLDGDALSRIVTDRASAIHGRMTLDSTPAVFAMRAARAQRLAANRTMLVGEAAHVFPPIGAQGLNLGLRDVAALTPVLLRHRGDPGCTAATDAYHRLRQADVRTRTAAVDMLNRSLLSDFLPVHAARGLGLALAGAVAPVRRMLMRQGLAGGTSRARR